MYSGVAIMENIMAVPQKLKSEVPQAQNTTSGYTSKNRESKILKKYSLTRVQRYSQEPKGEAARGATDWWWKDEMRSTHKGHFHP